MVNLEMFLILAILSIITAVTVVLAKDPIYSVLSLVMCLFTIAGHYFLLEATFLGLVHLIVYAGAIMVLFLFVIMLMNPKGYKESTIPMVQKSLIFVATACLSSILLGTLVRYSFKPMADSTTGLLNGSVGVLGVRLFGEFVAPFELASILFLAATVGVVFIGNFAKREHSQNEHSQREQSEL